LLPKRLCLAIGKLRTQLEPKAEAQNSTLPPSMQEKLQQLREKIEQIQVPSAQTEWSNYYNSEWFAFTPSVGWTQKHHTVYRVLSDLHPSSVLDMASNEGWYAQLAAILGATVVAFDNDETTITNQYRRNKGTNLPVLPLVMDFRSPSPGYGLLNLAYSPALKRFDCELVLALGLVHHLVFKQSLNFEQIINTLAAFSKKWLLVEFIPPDDQFVRLWSPEKFPWYTLDDFIVALEKQFRSVKVLPSSPDPRVFLLCEK
jgi:hypothetical protein